MTCEIFLCCPKSFPKMTGSLGKTTNKENKKAVCLPAMKDQCDEASTVLYTI